MIIYLDTCCYCRPFDAARHSQERVETETEIIFDTLVICKESGFSVVGSVVLTDEISRISDVTKRESVQSLYAGAVNENIAITASVVRRARELNAQGLGLQDAYHVALAEAANADYLLTADMKLEHAASALKLSIKVISPINFLPEVKKWLRSM